MLGVGQLLYQVELDGRAMWINFTDTVPPWGLASVYTTKAPDGEQY